MKIFCSILLLSFQVMAQNGTANYKAKSPSTIDAGKKSIHKTELSDFTKMNNNSLIIDKIKPEAKLLKELKGIEKANGGWGSSGGGGGVACFDSVARANQADEYIDANIAIPKNLKKHIATLVTLDYWEWQQKQSFKLIVPSSENYEKIISEVKSSMAFTAPLFIYRLLQVSQLIETSSWIGKESIQRIYDANPTENLTDNCRLVQLVARYTKDKYNKGDGPSSHLPIVKIEVDNDLFMQLDPLNKAILVLHEQMYLLGQILGYTTSDNIRPLVMNFFSENFLAKPTDISLSFEMRRRLVYYFGDYLMFFGDDQKVTGPIGSQESRFESFYSMLKTIREKIDACNYNYQKNSKTKQDKKSLPLCKDISMNPSENEKWLSEEMSFLFISYYIMDITNRSINAELVMAPFASLDFIQNANAQVNYTCTWIYQYGPSLRFTEMAQKAKRYCDLVNPSRSPMEIDQN
ncbi:MAG: hypothetical protein WA160_06470 [Pseudobdellovibrio sp.]